MKELLFSAAILIAGIVCMFFGGDFRFLIMGFIPITSKVLGIFGIVAGAIGVLACIGSLKKK